MTLTAPVAGTIQASTVTTLGQIVDAGQELMHIVPEGTPLEIEAYVLNRDAGFVAVGQEAVVKVDAFPYTRYGTMGGKVARLAEDAIPGAEAQQNLRDPSQAPSGTLALTSAAQQTQLPGPPRHYYSVGGCGCRNRRKFDAHLFGHDRHRGDKDGAATRD